MRGKPYVGISKLDGQRVVLRLGKQPTEAKYGRLYSAFIGPFRTVRAAKWMAQYGQGNPHLQTVDDAERAAAPKQRLHCDQCEMLSINGYPCHETGCPNANSRWDRNAQQWVKQRTCFDCGCTIDADDPCCSEPIQEAEN